MRTSAPLLAAPALVATVLVATVLVATVLAAAVTLATAGDDGAPAPAAGPPAGSAAGLRPGEVRFRPVAATEVWYVLRTSFHSEHKVPKQRAVGDGETTNDVLLTIGARDAAGATPVTVRVARTVGSWTDTEHGRIDFDTTQAPVPADSGAKQLVQYLAPASFRVFDDGRIVEVEDLIASQARAPGLARTDPARQEFETLGHAASGLLPFAATWPVLPAKRMGAGTFFETTSLPPWPMSPLYRLDLRHEVKVMDDTRVVFSTTGSVADLDPANRPGGSKKKAGQPSAPRIKTSGFAQSSEVDRADGLVRKSSARLSLVRVATFSVDGDSAEGTSTFVWEATLERRATPPDLPKTAAPPPNAPPASPPAPGTSPPDPGVTPPPPPEPPK